MAAPIYEIHVWQEHDNWWDIAYRYTGHGANWVHLADSNPHITNPNKVPVNTRVLIPWELTR